MFYPPVEQQVLFLDYPMLAVDTETTGLYLQSGCTTFAIGTYDGAEFSNYVMPIHITSRTRTRQFHNSIRDVLDSHDLLVMHNSHFDMKALCEAGLYDWDEPAQPAFWDKIINTGILGHLNCSTDRLALDELTKKYLDRGYPEDDNLIVTVNKCRALVRKRIEWVTAESKHCAHPAIISSMGTTQWNRMDFWLPAAVLAHIPQSERPGLPNSVLESVMLDYLEADVTNTYELAQHFFHELLQRHGDRTTELLNINRQIEHVVWKMETKGIWVNTPELTAAIDACHTQIKLLKCKVKELSGFEVITNAVLRELLFEKWDFTPISYTKATHAASADAATMLHCHNIAEEGSVEREFLCCNLSLKKYEKKLASLMGYCRSKSITGYVHPSINIVGTSTVRVSTKNPALQTVTKAINPYEDDAPDITAWLEASPSMRSVFGPPTGKWWLTADYSQLQLRIFAYVTDEQEMMEAFKAGWDAHDFVARKIFNIAPNDKPDKGQRRIAKNVNFGFIFGASPKKIEQTAGIPGLWGTVTSLFPHAHAFIEETKLLIKQQGFVTTLGDYPLELRDKLNKWSGQYDKAAHAGVNYIVQGAEGVIVKRAMRLCDDYLSSEYPEGRVALQVHDELNFEVPAKCPKKHVRALKQCMEDAATQYGIYAPVEIGLITHRWDQEVKIKL